jgi:hypothetical protein
MQKLFGAALVAAVKACSDPDCYKSFDDLCL